jgi:hypothetical protein
VGAVLGIKAKVVEEMKREGRRSWLWRRGSKRGKGKASGEGAGGEGDEEDGAEKVMVIKDSKGGKKKESDRRSKAMEKSTEFSEQEPGTVGKKEVVAGGGRRISKGSLRRASKEVKRSIDEAKS